MAKKAKKYFGYNMYLGLYFLNKWMEALGVDSTKEAFRKLSENGLKYYPVLVQVGANTYFEIKNQNKEVSFMEACDAVDEYGVAGEETKRLMRDLTKSMGIENAENLNPEKKNKPKVMKPEK